jgi:hypothetical protein
LHGQSNEGRPEVDRWPKIGNGACERSLSTNYWAMGCAVKAGCEIDEVDQVKERAKVLPRVDASEGKRARVGVGKVRQVRVDWGKGNLTWCDADKEVGSMPGEDIVRLVFDRGYGVINCYVC